MQAKTVRAALNNALVFWLSQKEVDQGKALKTLTERPSQIAKRIVQNCAEYIIGALFLTLQLFNTAHADDFTITTESTYEDQNTDLACRMAFREAETEALQKIDDFFSGTPTAKWRTLLTNQSETRTSGLEGSTHCTFNGTWSATIENASSALIGSEQGIEGEYNASCSRSHKNDHCWADIVAQAEQDLRDKLKQDYGDLKDLQLQYLYFEGRDREREGSHYSDITATGIFYFRVIDAIPGKISEQPHVYYQDHALSETELSTEDSLSSQRENNNHKSKDSVDFTLSYTWDHNNRAEHNEVAVSSDRWGIGIWTNNQIGFAAFLGTDTVGIGDADEKVNNGSGEYKTLGIGIGHRLFDNRAITIENMIYYVDAAPYRTTIAPSCDQCVDQTFQSENYLQATSNIKTNTHGVNIGWMFTWKWLESQSNLNHWSSGFYLELQL